MLAPLSYGVRSRQHLHVLSDNEIRALSLPSPVFKVRVSSWLEKSRFVADLASQAVPIANPFPVFAFVAILRFHTVPSNYRFQPIRLRCAPALG